MPEPQMKTLPKNEEGKLDASFPCISNSIYFGKPEYTTFVTDQVKITGMSYQDYYARYSKEINSMASKDDQMKFLLLLGLHKGDYRTIDAVRENGDNWRASGTLRADDKTYVDFAEKVLAQLKAVGISLDKSPEEVVDRIKEVFGKTGQEIVANARMMPIYGEVVTEKGSLQCGDRLLDKKYDGGGIRALREGDVAATAILYLTTLCTCQGVNVSDFIETAKKWENEAFSSSDDTEGLKRRGMTDSQIAEQKKTNFFAVGESMFTKYRYDRTPAYYLLNEQLNCVVALGCTMNSFFEGNAPKRIEVKGSLQITQDGQTDKEIAAERSVKREVAITLYKKLSESQDKGALYKPIYSTGSKTDRDGGFSASIPKEVLDGLKKGEYYIEARFTGEVRGEQLDCSDACPFNVETHKPLEVPKEKPLEVKREHEPMKVYVKYYFHPKVQTKVVGPATTIEKQLGQNEPLPDDTFTPKTMCHDLLRVTKQRSEESVTTLKTVKFGIEKVFRKELSIHGLVQVEATTATGKVGILAQRYFWGSLDKDPEETRKTIFLGRTKESKTRVGLELGYEKVVKLPKNYELDLQVRAGRVMGDDPRAISGLKASIGDLGKTVSFAAELTNELHRQTSLALSGTANVTSGFSGTIGVDDLNTKKPVLFIGISKEMF